ncbi:MAG: hypothetical protein Ct9H300mP4_06930 [Gammaproteobacteria bacterium]|nr:MAG: hypothetical protein Ct9H300mP4_06930 [Gammaproteobacteria bacterium]
MKQEGRRSVTHHNLQSNFLELYRSDNLIFSNISFELSKGQHLLISGANGNPGKTSLLRVICGLTMPTEGNPVMWDELATNNVDCTYQDHLAYLGHKNALISELTAKENLEYSLFKEISQLTVLTEFLKRLILITIWTNMLKNSPMVKCERSPYREFFCQIKHFGFWMSPLQT